MKLKKSIFSPIFFWQSDLHFPLVAPPNHLLLDKEAWLLFQKQMDLEVQFHAE